jgi:hypothetical protein
MKMRDFEAFSGSKGPKVLICLGVWGHSGGLKYPFRGILRGRGIIGGGGIELNLGRYCMLFQIEDDFMDFQGKFMDFRENQGFLRVPGTFRRTPFGGPPYPRNLARGLRPEVPPSGKGSFWAVRGL